MLDTIQLPASLVLILGTTFTLASGIWIQSEFKKSSGEMRFWVTVTSAIVAGIGVSLMLISGTYYIDYLSSHIVLVP